MIVSLARPKDILLRLAVITRTTMPKPQIAPPKFEDVAESVLSRHARLWKPSTLSVCRSYLRNQILPFFGALPIGDITHVHVRRWFASLAATPAAANRSLPVLSVILKGAEALGHRADDSNPCIGIKRHRLQGRSRFLTSGEMQRLGAALDAHEAHAQAVVAVVRLLLLTGARQGEIRRLQWRDYREGNLYLPDGKTGPRTVWLSSAARSVLDSLPETGHWVFPKPCGTEPTSTSTLYRHWHILRKDADLPDVRLNDLRHSYASFALRRGETVVTIGRLLGHRDPNTTLRYLHFADPLARQSTETVGAALAE